MIKVSRVLVDHLDSQAKPDFLVQLEQLVPQVTKAALASQDFQARVVNLDLQVLLGTEVLKDHQETPVTLVCQGHLVLQVHRGMLEQQVH